MLYAYRFIWVALVSALLVQPGWKLQRLCAGPGQGNGFRGNFAGMITLQEGDKAPVFTGVDQDGNKISLTDYKGKKLVLFFYPEDDTPTCTIQACNLRDNYGLLKREGFEVLGVSPDPPAKHKKFETKFSLPYRLIADPGHQIIDKYGVWGKKKLYGREYMGLQRTTFVLNEKGIISKIFLRPKNKQHAEEIIAAGKAFASSAGRTSVEGNLFQKSSNG